MRKIFLFLKKKYASSPSEQGFTLLEVLFAFSVFTTIIFFFAPVLQIVLNNSDSHARLQAMEWQVFCSQIKREIRISSKAEVVSGRLVLTNNNETIYYEKYNNSIRRRVNSTGHEVILQNVSAVTFLRQNRAVKINVKDIWGKEYSMLVHAYIQWVPAA